MEQTVAAANGGNDVVSESGAPPDLPNKRHTVGSLALAAGTVGGLLIMAWHLAFLVPKFTMIFEDFDAELPVLTAALTAVAGPVSAVIVVAVAAMIVVREFVVRSRRQRVSINLSAFVWTVVALVCIWMALAIPILKLITD